MPLAPVSFDAGQPVDLEASLLGGQAHRWKRASHPELVEGEWYSGVLRGVLVLIRQHGQEIEFLSSPLDPQAMIPTIRDHLRLDDDLKAIQAEITADPNVAVQVECYPGLRVLRQEPWECLIAYILSANSNIETIHRNMERLSNEFGEPLALPNPDSPSPSIEGAASNSPSPSIERVASNPPSLLRERVGVRVKELEDETITRNTFPKPVDLAEAGEAELRRLRLGFRAPYVHQAAIAVAERRLDLDYLVAAPYPESKAELMALKGIGDKIADCIALFSLEKMQAFPIDVWVRRALADWYFPNEKTPANRVLLEWAQSYFGRYAGYANQYLFHGRRLRDRTARWQQA